MDNHIEDIDTPSKRDKGFTLVELLIVIVILGILATVTVFAVRGITDRGKDSACAADRKTIETAAEAYFAVTGAYPATSAALAPSYLPKDIDSTKWTYAHVAAAGANPETFTLTGAGQCAGK